MAKFEIQTQTVEGVEKEVYVNTETGRVIQSKSHASEMIFREEAAKDADTEEKSLRQRYIARVTSEIGLSAKGAATYYQNEKNRERGEDKYKHNKASRVRAKQREEAAKAKEEKVEEVNTQAEEAKEIHRWQVVLKDTRELVDSFTGRKAAQDFNKAQKAAGKQTVMVDGNKKSA